MDTESDDFKKFINLLLMAETLGFKQDIKKSSVSTIVMRQNGSSECFHFFTNAQNKDQKGSVVDLVQLIKPDLNLGMVRQYLRPLLNQPALKKVWGEASISQFKK